MNRDIRWWSIAALFLCGGALLLAPSPMSRFAAAQEDAEEELRESLGPEQLERRLDVVEEAIERAEQRGDEAKIRELRREGERLLDQLEELERARREDDDDEDEGEWEWEAEARELEMHRMHLEIERLHQELSAALQESAIRLATIAANEQASASYAMMQAVEHLGEEEAIDFLTDLLEESDNAVIKRLILHQLATLNGHIDQPDAIRRTLRSLILRE